MKTAADRVAHGIRLMVASGEYLPGDRLPPERELARQLGVSRPALREGIRRLRSGGVLESRPGAGTFVATVDIENIFDIRIRLEPLAAERAALRRRADELTAMRAAIDRMRVELDDPVAYDAADAQFHDLVAHASRNPILQMTLSRLSELIQVSRMTLTDTDVRIGGLTDVERIYLAIRREHPHRAANAMEHHIAVVRDRWQSAVAREHRERYTEPTSSS